MPPSCWGYARGQGKEFAGVTMKTMGFSAVLAAVFALVIVAPRVAADAPCNKGYRDTTAAERAKMSAVLQTVKDAMPAPSPGWVIGAAPAESRSTPPAPVVCFSKRPKISGCRM